MSCLLSIGAAFAASRLQDQCVDSLSSIAGELQEASPAAFCHSVGMIVASILNVHETLPAIDAQFPLLVTACVQMESKLATGVCMLFAVGLKPKFRVPKP